MYKIVGETTTPSPSSSSSSIVKGSHEFKITGYSLSNGVGSGKYIRSETFSVDGHDFAIYYYPDGKNEDDNGEYVSMFIVLVSDGSEDVKALFELILLDQPGSENHKVHSQFQIVPESGPYSLRCSGSMWGFKRFIKKTELEKSNYLKDDCLYVNCSVEVVTSKDPPLSEGPN